MAKGTKAGGDSKQGNSTGKSHPLTKYYNDQKEPITRALNKVKWWG